jgi:hypothetical protein
VRRKVQLLQKQNAEESTAKDVKLQELGSHKYLDKM